MAAQFEQEETGAQYCNFDIEVLIADLEESMERVEGNKCTTTLRNRNARRLGKKSQREVGMFMMFVDTRWWIKSCKKGISERWKEKRQARTDGRTSCCRA